MYQNVVSTILETYVIMTMSDFIKQNQADAEAISLDSTEIIKSLPDTEIIEILYRKYSDYIYAIVREKILSVKLSADDADDCFSYLIIKLVENGCKKLRQYRGESSFKTYLTVACRNITVDFIRASIRRQRKIETIDDSEKIFRDWQLSHGLDPSPDNPETQFIKNERKLLIMKAAGQVRKEIEKLEYHELIIFRLRIEDGKTYHDIDLFLGINNSAYIFSKIVHKMRDAVDLRLRHSIEELLMET